MDLQVDLHTFYLRHLVGTRDRLFGFGKTAAVTTAAPQNRFVRRALIVNGDSFRGKDTWRVARGVDDGELPWVVTAGDFR